MRINRNFLALCRTVHIYLTLLGLLVMLLFGATGFTINHEDWFGATEPRLNEYEGTTPVVLVDSADDLAMVEYLREQFHITGAVTAFDDWDDRFSIGFKQPDQTWEVEIVKEDGATHVTRESFNFAALVNNLHRGRYSGPAWRWIIDVGAVLIVFACMTGVVLWLALPKRQKLGVFMLFVGAVGTILVYYFLVPGPDERLDAPGPIPGASSNG